MLRFLESAIKSSILILFSHFQKHNYGPANLNDQVPRRSVRLGYALSVKIFC